MQATPRHATPELQLRPHLNLDLFNFESSEAWDSPVVLTSPRSLAACRRAGVKPVDLLYRSERDISISLGDSVPLHVVHSLHTQHEEQRQVKLEACRSIRSQLVHRSGDSGYGASPDPPRRERSPDFINRHSRDFSKELTPDLSARNLSHGNFSGGSSGDLSPGDFFRELSGRGNYYADSPRDLGRRKERSVAFNLETPGWKEKQPHQNLNRSTSPENGSRGSSPSKGSTPLLTPPVSTPVSASSRRSGAGDCSKLPPSRTQTPPLTWTTSTWPSAISPNLSVATSPARSLRGASPSSTGRPRTVLVNCWGQAKSVPAHSVKSTRQIGRPTSWSSSSTPSESTGTASRLGRRPIRRPKIAVRRHPRRMRGLVPRVVVQDCDDGSRSRSKTPSDLVSFLPGSIVTDDVVVSEHDRRILESMALKKRKERSSEELAHRAHQLWEKEKIQRRQAESARQAKWQASVNARRQWEADDNARRMEAVKESLRLAQQRLEESIRLKEQRAQLRIMEDDVHRMMIMGERCKEYAMRREEVETRRLDLEERENNYRRLLEQELRLRQMQADGRRRRRQVQDHKRVASANREWERSRAERVWLVALRAEQEAVLQRATARSRHQRAESNKKRIRRRRRQRTLQASLEREARMLDARAMHADLALALQLTREQCAAVREDAARHAQERARQQKESAKTNVQRSNQRRRGRHRVLRARLQAEDEAKMRTMRRQIRNKDMRIVNLRFEKELALQDSRAQAYNTATLREELRRALSPETFDRMAARVEMEMRLSNRQCLAVPTPTVRSHIYLG